MKKYLIKCNDNCGNSLFIQDINNTFVIQIVSDYKRNFISKLIDCLEYLFKKDYLMKSDNIIIKKDKLNKIFIKGE